MQHEVWLDIRFHLSKRSEEVQEFKLIEREQLWHLASRFIPTRKALPSISWCKLCNCHILLLTIVIICTGKQNNNLNIYTLLLTQENYHLAENRRHLASFISKMAKRAIIGFDPIKDHIKYIWKHWFYLFLTVFNI